VESQPHTASTPNIESLQDWFAWATRCEPDRCSVVVDGASIETLQWGERGAPGMLLMHGSRAQADWWSFVAPIFAKSHRIAALSFSGMGRSQWRTAYSVAGMAREALTVAEAAGLFEASTAPVVIAHSLGGMPLLYLTNAHGDRIGGAVFLETLLRSPPVPIGARTPSPDLRHKVYASREEALSRYRLLPSQPVVDQSIVDFLARHGVVEVDTQNGSPAWTWRYDPAFIPKLEVGVAEQQLAQAQCPVALVRGECSPLVTETVMQEMLERLPANTPAVVIPAAGHHVFVDRPLAIIAALRALLAVWPRNAAVKR
jgi:pimeloyl-ACP methyl ester carboxylesterase